MLGTDVNQQAVVAFLGCSDTHAPIGPVDIVSTHISHIFLAGDRALKLKRAVKTPYLDFSTPGLRRLACEHELSLNRRTAPELYRAVLPITRTEDGSLSINGAGQPVDWVVEMQRFDQEQLLDRIAERGEFSRELQSRLADRIWEFHQAISPVTRQDPVSALELVLAEVGESFRDLPPGVFPATSVERLLRLLEYRITLAAPLLRSRVQSGKVRHCHGDLHLRNICVLQGRPVLFDCLEFSDALATIDVLYDLAFLLMDLLHRGLLSAANFVFNRYFDRSGECEGMSLFPLFLALRAAIRAHVSASVAGEHGPFEEARAYFRLALDLLATRPARLVAIGGLSGTGKSTLAYGLAPTLGNPPGARVLRTDVLRKFALGIVPEDKAPEAAYRPESTATVYASLNRSAAATLDCGHSAIADAVFATPVERSEIEAVATTRQVRFDGIWLQADAAELARRVANRQGDASDATVEVLNRQLNYQLGPIDWLTLYASGRSDQTLEAARVKLNRMD